MSISNKKIFFKIRIPLDFFFLSRVNLFCIVIDRLIKISQLVYDLIAQTSQVNIQIAIANITVSLEVFSSFKVITRQRPLKVGTRTLSNS